MPNINYEFLIILNRSIAVPEMSGIDEGAFLYWGWNADQERIKVPWMMRDYKSRPVAIKRSAYLRHWNRAYLPLLTFTTAAYRLLEPIRIFGGWHHTLRPCNTVTPKIGLILIFGSARMLIFKVRQQWARSGKLSNFTTRNILYW